MKSLTFLFVIAIPAIVFTGALAIAESDEFTDGEVRSAAGDGLEAWDIRNSEWVDLEVFWSRYADRRGGLTWGRRTDFPPYRRVLELDTMLIELESGPCLMEFFHTRWRRANDVRRWDEAFNEYGGCPDVFK